MWGNILYYIIWEISLDISNIEIIIMNEIKKRHQRIFQIVYNNCFPYDSIVFSKIVENGATSAIYINEVTWTSTAVVMKKVYKDPK